MRAARSIGANLHSATGSTMHYLRRLVADRLHLSAVHAVIVTAFGHAVRDVMHAAVLNFMIAMFVVRVCHDNPYMLRLSHIIRLNSRRTASSSSDGSCQTQVGGCRLRTARCSRCAINRRHACDFSSAGATPAGN
jgi:hypothetical protein